MKLVFCLASAFALAYISQGPAFRPRTADAVSMAGQAIRLCLELACHAQVKWCVQGKKIWRDTHCQATLEAYPLGVRQLMNQLD